MPLIANADQIKQGADIADIIGRRIALRESRDGSHLEGSCPFHKSKSGKSFHVTPDRQLWYCWGCQEGGTAVSFVMKFDNVSYPEALEIIASESRIPVRYENGGAQCEPVAHPPRQDVQSALEAACAWYEAELRNPRNAAAMEYIQGRGFGDGTLKKYRIGYSMGASVANCGVPQELLKAAGVISVSDDGRVYDPLEGRIVIPIRDNIGRPAGFTGRLIAEGGSRPKYLNTGATLMFNKSRMLFGWKESRDILRSVFNAKYLYIIEGQLKTIAMLESGYPTVAAGGTAFTDIQVAMVSRLTDKIIVVPDPDEAGTKAAIRTANSLRAAELNVQIGDLDREQDPTAKDPDDLWRQHMPIRFYAESPVHFMYRQIAHTHVKTAEEAKAVAKTIVPFIMAHPIPAVQQVELRELSSLSGLLESALVGKNPEEGITTRTEQPRQQMKVTEELPPERMLIAIILQTGVTADHPDWYAHFNNYQELPWFVFACLQELTWTFRYALSHGVSVADALPVTVTPERLPWYKYWLSCDTGEPVSRERAAGLARQIIAEARNSASMQAARTGRLELSQLMQQWR